MKMYDKINLDYKNGFVVQGDEIVPVSGAIVYLFNKVEEDIQKAKFKRENKVLEPVDLKIFERKSEHKVSVPVVDPDTPAHDKWVEESIAIMNDIDVMNKTKEINEYIESIEPLFEFVDNDYIVAGDFSNVPGRFDLPTIGNPITLTREKLTELVFDIFDITM